MSAAPRQPDPLQDWAQWHCFAHRPRLVRKLGHGKGQTNQSYLIESERQSFVLRRSPAHAGRLGIDRQREADILAAVSELGIAPPVLVSLPEQGILISQYIAGRHRQNISSLDSRDLERLVELLKKTHEMNIALPDFDYLAHLDNYWQQLQKKDTAIPDLLYEEYEAVSAWLTSHKGKRTLCHHDPNPHNIIEADGRLYLLDWEYAGYGWPAFDYAALSLEWQVSLEKESLLPEEMTQQLQQQRVFYRHLCHVWALLRKL